MQIVAWIDHFRFNLFQLPSRQGPVVDASKYTAADVRIVSTWFVFYNCDPISILRNFSGFIYVAKDLSI